MDHPGATLSAHEVFQSRERRTALRVLTALEVAYEDALRQVFLRTRDLSESGVFLWAPEPAEVGTEARLLVELPGQSPLLRLSGKVARCDFGSPSGFAVRFEGPPAESARQALRAYVLRLALPEEASP